MDYKQILNEATPIEIIKAVSALMNGGEPDIGGWGRFNDGSTHLSVSLTAQVGEDRFSECKCSLSASSNSDEVVLTVHPDEYLCTLEEWIDNVRMEGPESVLEVISALSR